MLRHGAGWDPWPAPMRLAPTHLQEVIAEALVVFEGRPAGEVASPEHVGAISIGEEVILFHRPAAAEALRSKSLPTGHANPPQAPPAPQIPGELGLVQLPEVAGRSGVENIDTAPIGLLLGEGVACVSPLESATS